MLYIPNERDGVKEYGKGIQMTFENGNTISIMFGKGNYCENKRGVTENDGNKSGTAEIAIWNAAGNDYEFAENRTIEGWIKPDDVSKWIHFAANNIF